MVGRVRLQCSRSKQELADNSVQCRIRRRLKLAVGDKEVDLLFNPGSQGYRFRRTHMPVFVVP